MNGNPSIIDNFWNGLRLVETTAVTKEVQARTHRKKRINKKWLKRYGLKRVPDFTAIYIATMPDGCKCIFAQPKMIKMIKEAVIDENIPT